MVLFLTGYSEEVNDFFFIEVQWIYSIINIILDSAVEHNDSIFVCIVKYHSKSTPVILHSYILFLVMSTYAFFISEFNMGNFGCISDYESCVNVHFLQVLEKLRHMPITLGRNKLSSLLPCS